MNAHTPPEKLVRFDFPPGATPAQIAEALRKAYDEIMAVSATFLL
jgi:hypothetical protein